MTQAIVDHSIRVPLSELDPSAAEEIRKTLTVWNKARADAIEREEYGAEDAPEWIELWRHDGTDLVLPRGFKIPLERGLAGLGQPVRWVDRTSRAPVDFWTSMNMQGPTLKLEQERLVQEMMAHGGGILQAPTGSGKTVMLLEMWRRLGLRGLILVEKGHLVRQWMERARQHLDYEPGFIGDGQWEEKDLTIAMLQTLHSRLEEIPQSWFDSWGLTEGDEIHHAVAPTYRKVLSRCSSAYFGGATATPLEGDWRQPMLTSLVGPIVARSDHRELEPTIVQVKTGWRWAPQTEIRNAGKYYQALQVALAQDNVRNWTVARVVAAQPESCAQLVLSKRLKHLELLRDIISQAGVPPHRTFMLRGSESLDEREEVQARAAEGGCVILSTIAGEGFDVPRLDRLHLPWPQKRGLTITQQVGRVLRSHPTKLDPIVFDYTDNEMPVLRKQWMERLHGTYLANRWTVQQMERGSS